MTDFPPITEPKPRMTVIGIVDTATVAVAWCRYDTGEMHRDVLPKVALRPDWK